MAGRDDPTAAHADHGDAFAQFAGGRGNVRRGRSGNAQDSRRLRDAYRGDRWVVQNVYRVQLFWLLHDPYGKVTTVRREVRLVTESRSKAKKGFAAATGEIPKSRQPITVRFVTASAPATRSGNLEVDPTLRVEWSDVKGSQVLINAGRPATYWAMSPVPPKKPTKVDGVYCPAWFVVDGLPNRVAFHCDNVDGRFQITRVTLDALDNGALSEVDRLPLATMLELAYKAAAVTGIEYPANYDGPLLTFDNRGRMVATSVRLKTGTVRLDNCDPIVNGRVVSDSELKDVAGRGKGSHSRRPRTDDIVAAAAKALNDADPDKRDGDGNRIPRNRQAAELLAAAGYVNRDQPFSDSYVGSLGTKAKSQGLEVIEWRNTEGGKK